MSRIFVWVPGLKRIQDDELAYKTAKFAIKYFL